MGRGSSGITPIIIIVTSYKGAHIRHLVMLKALKHTISPARYVGLRLNYVIYSINIATSYELIQETTNKQDEHSSHCKLWFSVQIFLLIIHARFSDTQGIALVWF